MPAIRDWSFNYGTTTTATTISCPLPAYEQNDLLLAVLSTDTGTTQAWSSTGWTQLFSQSNTPNLAVMYKIAGSSESDPTFTYTISETANAAILSIRDVDTTTPIANNAQSNITAARTAFPTTTAGRDNSLLIYSWNHGTTATVIPSAIEGPVTQLTSKDGSAHNDGVAWGFMPSSGTTPAITCSLTGTTYNGLKAVVVINPPSGGATVIPTYCAADNSVYVDPIHGTTAYNGNTAWAGTALTYWSTPLAGRTLANATVSAQTDRGINTYRSCGGMTGPATATSTWFGATKVLATANKPNVTGKNVLLHVMPLLPADLQTVDGANLGRGIAVGMASSANNAKTWHVHGAGTPWGISRAPVVVNSDNTSGVIDTQGTFDPSSVLVFGCFTAGFLVSSDWFWTMIWVLDTTTIAGGNATEPIGITGIRIAAADGHERMSVIQQAANQLLALQPLQFGDGGTSPTYLRLDSTAIEFPEIYNKTTRQVYYCSADNVAGITYYAGPSDTIIHSNSIISSASKYHWKFHSSSSTSATYDFTGLSVLGAGTISLVNNLPLAGILWSGCDGFSSAGAFLDNCEIAESVGTSALTVSSTTNMSRITNCVFTNNNDGDIGHSIELTATGTYTFDNISFSGGGVAERSFNTGTGVNSSTDILTTDAAHGYADGDAIYYQDQGGVVNMGLTDGTLYYVNAQSTTTLSFHTSKTNAIADTSRVNLTSGGSETHYIYSAKADVYNNSGGAITINVSNGGDTPTVRNSNGSSTTIVASVNVTVTVKNQSGAVIPGVEVAIFQDNTARTVLLASTPTDDLGQVTTSASANLGPIIIRARQSSNIASFSTAQAFTSEVVTTDANHNFQDGDAVVYSKNGGTAAIGLTAGTTYYVNSITSTTLSLHTTAANAIADTSRVDLTTNGSETHKLDPVRYVAASATGTIGSGDFSAQITMVTDAIATG